MKSQLHDNKDGPEFLKVGTKGDTGTAAAAAVTTVLPSGKITTEALTTAAAALYTLVITCPAILATDLCFASVGDGSNTQGAPVITNVKAADGSLIVEVKNVHASEALNGTLIIDYMAVRQA